jgi:hypothetical protein
MERFFTQQLLQHACYDSAYGLATTKSQQGYCRLARNTNSNITSANGCKKEQVTKWRM